jgi:NADPH:quinone reductase-like Zn-dependent oxidoreductase
MLRLLNNGKEKFLCVEATAMGGRISVITAPADGAATFNLRSIYRKELRIAGVHTRRLDVVACARLLAQMRSGFESGQFKVSLGRPFPLAEAGQAHEQAAAGKGAVSSSAE